MKSCPPAPTGHQDAGVSARRPSRSSRRLTAAPNSSAASSRKSDDPVVRNSLSSRRRPWSERPSISAPLSASGDCSHSGSIAATNSRPTASATRLRAILAAGRPTSRRCRLPPARSLRVVEIIRCPSGAPSSSTRSRARPAGVLESSKTMAETWSASGTTSPSASGRARGGWSGITTAAAAAASTLDCMKVPRQKKAARQ